MATMPLGWRKQHVSRRRGASLQNFHSLTTLAEAGSGKAFARSKNYINDIIF